MTMYGCGGTVSLSMTSVLEYDERLASDHSPFTWYSLDRRLDKVSSPNGGGW
jgi:hypothetical protein